MNKAKFTSGPWEVSSLVMVVSLEPCKIIANLLPLGVPDLDTTLEEAAANACLIAAALDLLAACKASLVEFNAVLMDAVGTDAGGRRNMRWMPIERQLRAAIAKATKGTE